MREHVPARIAELPPRDQDGTPGGSLQDLEGKFVVLAPELYVVSGDLSDDQREHAPGCSRRSSFRH